MAIKKTELYNEEFLGFQKWVMGTFENWLATLAAEVQTELDRVFQNLTRRLKQLAECYATPLLKLQDDVEVLSASINEHLAKMGFRP